LVVPNWEKGNNFQNMVFADPETPTAFVSKESWRGGRGEKRGEERGQKVQS